MNENLSPHELINFQNNYPATQQQIISDHKLLIEQEKNTLSDRIIQLDHSIKTKKRAVKQRLLLELVKLKNKLANLPSTHSNIIQTLINSVKKISLELRIWINKLLFNFKIAYSLKHLSPSYNKANNRYQYIDLHFDDAVKKNCLPQLKELDRKKKVIDQINNSIYGAIGEEKVVRELEKLSDDHILINDFQCKFDRAIYNKKQNDYIKSVQIDHILLSPAGVFLIETKNWSQHSISNPNLYSPVQQIKRANLALYKILNREFSTVDLIFTKHHWGSRKVPVKNLIVFTNYKPVEEFQYVKILTSNELLNYVRYFRPCFSSNEIQSMANYLLKI